MGKIIDLTEEPDHEILTTTTADGLFGGAYLADEPLESYLDGDEQPRYVLRNKKSGLTVDGEQRRTLEPDSGFQMLALVTDLRIQFVAGKEGGDQSMALSIADVVEAAVESGLRTSTLSIETLDGETWTFPCRGDPAQVATDIEEAAQLWANAARLFDDVEEDLGFTQDLITAGEYDSAREQIDGAGETIETATARIAEVGPAAAEQMSDRAATLHEWLVDLERELAAGEAASAHSRAHEHWEDGKYESAATAYEQAIAAYQQALRTEGSVPDTESLRARLAGAAGEREILRAGPLIDADTTRRRASALADPEDSAAEWKRALDAYRELLGLDWAETERTFVADRDLIRDQTAEIADDAIDDHHEAGRQWLRSGDKLAVQDRQRQATQVYERAREQFEHAQQLAREVRPDRIDELGEPLEAATDRLDGNRPAEAVPDDPVGFEPETATRGDTREDGETDGDDIDGISELAFHDSGDTAAQTDGTPNPETDQSNRPAFDGEQGNAESVLDRIQAQKRATSRGTAPDDTRKDTDSSREPQKERSAGSPDDETDPETAQTQLTDEQLRARLDELDTDELIEVIEALWEAEGWLTTVFDGAGETVYDVVAVDEETDERILLWAVTGSDGPVDRTLIKQCATTVENSHGSDGAVVVTTASITPSAETQAAQHDVTVVGTSELLDRVQTAGESGIVGGKSPQT